MWSMGIARWWDCGDTVTIPLLREWQPRSHDMVECLLSKYGDVQVPSLFFSLLTKIYNTSITSFPYGSDISEL